MTEMFKFILEDTYFQFFAWVVGVLSGIIALYEVFKEKKENDKQVDIIIRETARGKCVDCDNIISVNTRVCNKCGSEKPFDGKELIKKAEALLYFNFDITSRLVKYNDLIKKDIKEYVYLFIPSFIFIILILAIAYYLKNKYFDYFSAIAQLFYFVFLFYYPYILLENYTGNFSFSKCSSEQLFNLDTELFYIINAAKQGEALDEILYILKNYINELEALKKTKFYNYSFLIAIYNLILYIVFLFLIWIAPSLVNKFDFKNILESLLGLFIFLIIFYFHLMGVIKFTWIYFVYLTNATSQQCIEMLKKHIKP